MDIEQLKAKVAEIQAKIAEIKAGERTPKGAEQLVALRAELATAQAEVETAVAEQAKIDEAFADADGDTAGDEAGKDGGAGTDPAGGDKPAEKPAETKPADGDEAGKDGGDAGVKPTEGAPVTLAAGGAAGGASPTAHEDDAHQPGVAPMVLTASGSAVGAGIAPGGALDRDGLVKVLTAAASAATVETGRNRILSFERFGADLDQADTLNDFANTPIANTRLIAKARAEFAATKGKGNRPVALTAAGCFCGPDELIRLTGVVGRRGRPFAGMFPTIPISGGFRAMPDLAFNVDTGLRSGVSQWTCTNQAAVDPSDPSTLKPCAELECFTETTYTPYAVMACITVERFHQWAHPEQIDAWVNLLGIEYDALAETLLIDQVETEAGTPLTVGDTGDLMADFSLVAKIIYALSSMAYPLGYQFREGAGVLEGYTLSVPVGFAEALYADEKLRGFPSQLNSKEAIVASIESGTGVRMVERLDESTSRKAAAAATVTALNAGGAIDDNTTPLLPPTFRMYLIPLEGYVHGEGSIVNADWHVDTVMLSQNRMRYFWENVEILANLSVRKPHIIDVPGVIVGAYTDLTAGPVPT